MPRGRRKKINRDVAKEEVRDDASWSLVPSEESLATKKIIIPESEAEKTSVIFSDVTDLTETEKNDIAAYCTDLVDSTYKSEAWDRHMTRLQYCWDAYEQKSVGRSKPFKNAPDVRVDFDASMVDGFISRQLAGNFDVSPLVHIEGQEAGDVPKAPKIESFLEWWHWRKVHLYNVAATGFLHKCVAGHQVTKVVWNQDIQRVMRTREMMEFKKGKQIEWVSPLDRYKMLDMVKQGFDPTGKIQMMKVDENVYRHNGPALVDVPPEDYIFPIETTPANGKPRWEGHRIWFSADDIVRQIAQKAFYKECLEPIKGHGALKKVVENDLSDQEHAGNTSANQYAVHQLLVPYRRESDPYERVYLFHVHVPTKTLCRAQYHPYDHGCSFFVHNRLYHSRGFWGFGIPWAVRHISWVCSELVNQMVESGFLANSLNFKYKKGKGFDPGRHPFTPGLGVGLDNMEDLQELNIGGRRVVMDINLMRTLRDMAESRVGFGRLQSGQADPRQRTARGVLALLREGSLTFDRTIKADQEWAETICEQEVQLFQQFIQREGIGFRNIKMSVDRLLNEPGAADEIFPRMTPEDIQGMYDYTAMGSSNVAQRELNLQLNQLLYDTLKDNVVVRTSPRSIYKLTEDLVASTGKKSQILPTLEEFLQALGLQQQGNLMDMARQELAKRGASPKEIEQVLANLQAQGQMPAGQPGATATVPSAPPGAVEAASPGAAIPATGPI